jgi:formylglycine-generating enzyme required for sulfatase activity
MSISVRGIEQAIAGLNYRNPSAVKSRLLNVIKQYYDGVESPETMRAIATDDLVQKIWELESGPSAIQSKRKNLSSIKSTINADLDRAWREGRNPEGIMIGSDNTFTMSTAAKDRMLASFSGALSADGTFKMDEVNAALKLISEFLSSRKDTEITGELEKLRGIVKKVTEEAGEDDLSGYDIVKKGENKHQDGGGSGEKTGGAGTVAGEKIQGDLTTGGSTDRVMIADPEGPDSETDVSAAYEDDGVEELLEELSELDEAPLPEADETTEEDGAEGLKEMETLMTDESAVLDEDVITDDMEQEELSESLDDELELETVELEEAIFDIEEALEEGSDQDGIPEEVQDLTNTEEFPEAEEAEEVEEVEEVEETEEIEVAEDDEIEEIADEDAEIMEEAPTPLDEDVELVDEEALELMEELEEGSPDASAETAALAALEAGPGGDLNEVGDHTDTEEFPEVEEEVEEVEEVEDVEETEEIEVTEDDEIEEIADEDAEIVEEAPTPLDEDVKLADEEALELMEELEEGEPDGSAPAALPPPEAPVSEPVSDSRGDAAEASGVEEVEDSIDTEELSEVEEVEETEEIEIAEEDEIAEILDEDAELVEEVPAAVDEDIELVDGEDLELLDADEIDELMEAPLDDVSEPTDEVMDEIEELVEEALSDEDIEGGEEEVSDEQVDPDPKIETDDASDGVDEIVNKLLGRNPEDAQSEKSPRQTDNWMQNVGLPVDMFDEDGIGFENLAKDTEKKKVLAERFDGYLGVMERYYNQFITIPEGHYVVGGKGDTEDELPFQKIPISEYFIGKFPITNAMFEIFVDRTGYVTTAEKQGYGYVYYGRFQKIVDDKTGRSRSVWNPTYTRNKVEGASWFQPLGPGSSLHNKRNHPVVQVSIKDAKSFAAWTGKRLPTEIEWEAAARTTDGRRLPWGEQWCENVCNVESSGISDTTAVNQYPGGDNPFGISDLLGNVMEWTNDQCEPKYEIERKTIFYIAKGGGWIADSRLTLSTRFRMAADFSSNLLGFRCVVE